MRVDSFMLTVKLSVFGGFSILAENLLLGFSTVQWIVSSAVYYGILLLYLRRTGLLSSDKVGDL